jgi:uncharacterized membrane protein YhhN
VFPSEDPAVALSIDGMSRARPLLPSAVYAALAVADSVAAGRRGTTARRLRYVLKPALMPSLAIAFLDGTRDLQDRDVTVLRTGTAAAQAFSWGGDVALLGLGERSFLTGVGSFAGAHVAYIAAFLSVRGEGRDHNSTGLKVALGLWLTTAPLMSVAAGRRDPTLRVPVAAYATVLAAMFASSHLLDPALPQRARRTLQAGTALFLLSDSVLAAQEFLLSEPRPVLDSVVMTTYTAGQGLIAAGVAAAARGA